MYLLYLDDSGSVRNPNDKHLILAGVCVSQTRPYWLTGALDRIAERVWPDNPQSIEFRGSAIFSGRKHWRGIDKNVRLDAYRDALRILANDRTLRVFGAAIHKVAFAPNDPMEYAFEQLSNRFDLFLLRLHRENKTDRGLIILDKSSYETSLQSLATEFRLTGHKWGQLRNIADVPMFVDSEATRLIQIADLVAYAFRRYYEYGDSTYSDIIRPRLDAEGGIIHGLVHYTPQGSGCNCYVCRQRPM